MPDILRFRGFPRNALEFPVPSDYISGCYLSFNSTTLLNVSTGTCWSNTYGGCITIASAFTISPSLAASTIYYVYLTGESSAYATTLTPTNYQGTAWQDGSGNRYIGAFLTDASSHIYNFKRIGNEVRYRVDIAASPFAVSLANVVTSTSKSFSTLIPTTSTRMIAITGSSTQTISYGSSDGVTPSGGHGDVILGAVAAGVLPWTQNTLNLNTSQALLYFGGAATCFVMGYLEDR